MKDSRTQFNMVMFTAAIILPFMFPIKDPPTEGPALPATQVRTVHTEPRPPVAKPARTGLKSSAAPKPQPKVWTPEL